MRTSNWLILSPILTIAGIFGVCPGTLPSPAIPSTSEDHLLSTCPEDGSTCRCGHHHEEDQALAPKVDRDAYPDAVCSAPEPAFSSRPDPLSVNARLLKEEPLLKRVSVTAVVRRALADQKRMLLAKESEMESWGPAIQAHFALWFGTVEDRARETIYRRIVTLLKINENYSEANFRRSERPTPGTFAYVYPADTTKIFLDGAFIAAPAVGANSKAGTLSHEMSHFTKAGGTKDHAYGQAKCRELARTKPDLALTNADSFEFFIENAR